MTADDIQTGNPKLDGRYLAFFQCRAAACADWVEPVIMAWSKGKWETTFGVTSHIIGWIKIPVVKLAEIKPARSDAVQTIDTAGDRVEVYDL